MTSRGIYASRILSLGGGTKPLHLEKNGEEKWFIVSKNVYNSGTVKDAKQCHIYLESTEQMWSVDVLTNIVGPLVLPQCPL